MKICDKCGVANADDAAFCTGCGAVFSAGVSSYTNSNSSYEQPSYTQPTQSPFVQPVYSQPAQPAQSQVQQYVQPIYTQPVQPVMPYSQYGVVNENMLPPEYRPVTIGQYIGYSFLFGIPIIGFIMLLITAFGSEDKISLKNYAKAILLLQVILVAIYFVLFLFAATIFDEIF